MNKYFENSALICVAILFGITPLEHVPALRLGLLAILFVTSMLVVRPSLISVIKSLPFLFGWALFCTLSFFWSVRPDSTLFHIKHDLLPPLLGFLAIYALARNDRINQAVKYGILICAIANFIVSFFGKFLGYESVIRYYPDVGFSSTIAIVTMMYGCCIKLSDNENRAIELTIILLSVITGIISANRMFIVLAGVVVVFYIGLNFKLNRKRLVAIFFGAFFLVVCSKVALSNVVSQGWKFDYIISRYQSINVQKDTRREIWGMWIAHANKTPIFGSGFGRNVGNYTFGRTNNKELVAVDSFATMHSHNIFIQSYVETGVVGLMLFVGMFANFAKRYIEFIKLNKSLALTGISIMLVYIAKNQTDIFTIYSTQLLFFCLMGYYFGCLHRLNINNDI